MHPGIVVAAVVEAIRTSLIFTKAAGRRPIASTIVDGAAARTAAVRAFPS